MKGNTARVHRCLWNTLGGTPRPLQRPYGCPSIRGRRYSRGKGFPKVVAIGLKKTHGSLTEKELISAMKSLNPDVEEEKIREFFSKTGCHREGPYGVSKYAMFM
eukprot:1391777-Amorphochlora_amoeboformis.AAC.1